MSGMLVTGATNGPAFDRLVAIMAPQDRQMIGVVPFYGEYASKHGDNAMPYSPKVQRRFERAYEIVAARCLLDSGQYLNRMSVVETEEEVWWYAFADGMR